MIDIAGILNDLSKKRKIFVSEADFQFALSWEIKNRMPEAEIRLEYCPMDIDQSMHIDILVIIDGFMYPIELKYMTKQCDVRDNKERFILKNQGAQDTRRYDFIKDICRVEKLSKTMSKFKEGYCIALTNDPSYWNGNSNNATCDANFRINDKSIKQGKLEWAEHTGKGTNKNREDALILNDIYYINWVDYSKVSDNSSGLLKYVCLKIENRKVEVNDFWIYENWTAEKKAVIHNASCSHCNNGKGNGRNKLGNQNGTWHGRYETYEDANSFALTLKDREIKACGTCKPDKLIGDLGLLKYSDIQSLDAFVGGFHSGNYNVSINFTSGAVVWSNDFCKENKTKMNLSKEVLIKIKEELNKISLFTWNDNYMNNDIMDGTQWSVKVKTKFGIIKKYGSNEYPEQWNKFCVLIATTIGKAFE